MNILEIFIGILILAGCILVSAACYLVKNEKGGVNAALGGASDYMTSRRDDNNLKLNKFVAIAAIIITALILLISMMSARL